jgi:hypothetical protein
MTDRKYDSQSINYSNETKWIFDKLKLFFETETNNQIQTIKNKLHFHKFVKGDWFGKHNDIRENRLYAVGVLLNDNLKSFDELKHLNNIKLEQIKNNTDEIGNVNELFKLYFIFGFNINL